MQKTGRTRAEVCAGYGYRTNRAAKNGYRFGEMAIGERER